MRIYERIQTIENFALDWRDLVILIFIRRRSEQIVNKRHEKLARRNIESEPDVTSICDTTSLRHVTKRRKTPLEDRTKGIETKSSTLNRKLLRDLTSKKNIEGQIVCDGH